MREFAPCRPGVTAVAPGPIPLGRVVAWPVALRSDPRNCASPYPRARPSRAVGCGTALEHSGRSGSSPSKLVASFEPEAQQDAQPSATPALGLPDHPVADPPEPLRTAAGGPERPGRPQ